MIDFNLIWKISINLILLFMLFGIWLGLSRFRKEKINEVLRK